MIATAALTQVAPQLDFEKKSRKQDRIPPSQALQIRAQTRAHRSTYRGNRATMRMTVEQSHGYVHESVERSSQLRQPRL